MAVGIQAAIENMRERAQRFDRRAEGYEAMIRRVMDAAALTKVTLPIATLSMAKGRPAVTVTDEDMLPEQFWRVRRDVNKTAINDAIKAGETVPGVEVNTNVAPSLRINQR